MKTVGIISEYNPFHAGHAYHIQEAKQRTNADYAIVILNGDFTQRGEPAIFDKYTRAKQALEGGADLIFELPVRFGISSAGDFAFGGVLALESLGFIDTLCFGSEIGELAVLQKAADVLEKEPETFCTILSQALRQGLSFPAARSQALSATSALDPALLKEPNNILGIEYCLALRRLSSSIEPVTIPRKGQHYNEDTVCNPDEFPSASSLRRSICKEGTRAHLQLDDFSAVIGYSLLKAKSLHTFKDITPDLEDRIQHFLPDYTTASSLVEQCRTSAFTTGRIRRCLLQCLLGLKDTDSSMPYLRLLGMKKEASSLLSHKENASCLILSRLAQDRKNLTPAADTLLQQDLFASDLYRQTWCRKYNVTLPNEYQHSPLVI